jgi:hypothetical protein
VMRKMRDEEENKYVSPYLRMKQTDEVGWK